MQDDDFNEAMSFFARFFGCATLAAVILIFALAAAVKWVIS